MAYAVIFNKIDKFVWIGIGLIILEGVVLLIFNKVCPLTIVARKYPDSTKDNFDIYLPNWLAKWNKLIYTIKIMFSKSLQFFSLVFVLSIPFLILGMIVKGVTEMLPMKLPISALMAYCPLIAATILVFKKQKMNGVKDLLKQAFDVNKITDKKWYVPILFLIPVLTLISYCYQGASVIPTESKVPILTIVFFFIVFFIGAIGEEIGWSGYIIDPLQNQFGALNASIILGSIWAIWHIIPYSQAGQTWIWIFWQCIGTVFLRIIMVWLFNNTGKSVFGMVLFHTMINLSPFIIPNNGVHYDPFIFDILLMLVVIIIVLFWDTKTLTKYKNA